MEAERNKEIGERRTTPRDPDVSESKKEMEELRLKRMTVSDESLKFLGWSFPAFKALSFVSCDGFSNDGLAFIARCCRNLTELDIQECVIDDRRGSWLSCFPESFPENFTHFRLCIMNMHEPDYLTNKPMDEAFGAVVKTCTKLQRFAVSGLLTNLAFEYIGTHAKNLETLSVAFAGSSDRGMRCVLEGCLKFFISA